MNVPSDAPRRYRIVLRGECGDAFADLFSDVTVESGHGQTCVVVAVRDASEFYGLLDRFQDLALLPVSISEIDAATTVAELSGRLPARDRRTGPWPATPPYVRMNDLEFQARSCVDLRRDFGLRGGSGASSCTSVSPEPGSSPN